jgi:hypothetical protein
MTHVSSIVIDCADPGSLASFWMRVLDTGNPRRWQDEKGTTYVQIQPAPQGAPSLLFQPVAEGKATKNRLHLDIAPEGGTQSEEVDRLIGLGARRLSDDPDLPWVVLADPEGNEFCVLPPRE